MDRYEKALEQARNYYPDNLFLDTIFPELAESEDDRIMKFLKDYTIEMIAGLESDISISVYDGVKGHDPEAEAELEKWKGVRAWLEKQKEQKPAEWSLTDATFIEEIDETLFMAETGRNEVVKNQIERERNWLKSLPERFSLHPAEWSEEDEKMLRTIISDGSRGVELDSKQIDFLKSLRPQHHWKPSEEQIWALERAITTCERIGGDQSRLKALCEQLKLM